MAALPAVEVVMAAEEAASDTLWFMPEPAVMVLC